MSEEQEPNRLRIRAESLDLNFEGEPEYVQRAYEAVRVVLMDRFRSSLQLNVEQPMPTGAYPVAPASSRQHINVVLCNDVYNKIYLVGRDEVATTIFANVLDMNAVNRVYINRSQQKKFEKFFKLGKVLWRELTTAGKAAVKKGK